MSEFHQSYQSPLIHEPQAVTVSALVGVWTQLDFAVPVEKDRYWLYIPHPGFDFRLSWDGGVTHTTHTDNYLTPIIQGIQRDEVVHFSVDIVQPGATIDLDYFLMLPFFNRVLT